MFHFGLVIAALQPKHVAQKLTTEFYLTVDVVCDLETSRMGAPYIYIYDISHLRVKVAGT